MPDSLALIAEKPHRIAEPGGIDMIERILKKGGTSLEDSRRVKAAERILNLLDRDVDNTVDWREIAMALSMLSLGSIEDRLRLAFALYDQDHDAFLSREDLRIMLHGLSLPPREPKQLREMEDLLILHADPANSAGGGMAERRQYNRTRHMKPRFVDQTACLRLEDLMHALKVEEKLSKWLNQQPHTFREKLRDGAAYLQQKPKRRLGSWVQEPAAVCQTRGRVTIPRYESRAATAKRGATAAERLLLTNTVARPTPDQTGRSVYEITKQIVGPGTSAPPEAWGQTRLVMTRQLDVPAEKASSQLQEKRQDLNLERLRRTGEVRVRR